MAVRAIAGDSSEVSGVLNRMMLERAECHHEEGKRYRVYVTAVYHRLALSCGIAERRTPGQETGIYSYPITHAGLSCWSRENTTPSRRITRPVFVACPMVGPSEPTVGRWSLLVFPHT